MKQLETKVQYCLKGRWTTAWQDSDVGLKEKAKLMEPDEDMPCQILMQVITTSVQDEWMEPAFVPEYPNWEDVAQNMSAVHAESIDWTDEEYLRLTLEDRGKAKKAIYEETDSCQLCGWDFGREYLSEDGVCDACERQKAEYEAEEEE